MVTAPAGFGKTTLLYQWYAELQRQGMAASWLSLEEGDDDPHLFLAHLIQSLQQESPELGVAALQLLRARRRLDPQEALVSMLNDLTRDQRQRCLVIDDLHFAATAEVTALLTAALNRSPPQLAWVIGSRIRPDLDFASLRGYGLLREVTAADLRFSSDEAQTLLATVSGQEVGAELAANINDAADGWATGLQLVGLSADPGFGLVDWQRGTTGGSDTADATAAFAGARDDLGRFLTRHVFDRQSEAIQSFLLHSAVATYLSASLCAALTGRGDSAEVLSDLEHAGLFITPLDRQRRLYRYHHLFRDYLLDLLESRHPGLRQSLLARASHWAEEHDEQADAVNYALDAGLFDRAADLVSRYALGTIRRGGMPQVAQWMRRLPQDVWQRRIDLSLFNVWALFHSNEPETARAALQQAKAVVADSIAQGHLSPEDATARGRELALLEAGVAITEDDPAAVIAQIDASPEAEAQDSDWLLGTINNIAGYALTRLSRFEDAAARLDAALRHHRRGGSPVGIVWARSFRGLLALAQGQLHAAAAQFQSAEDQGRALTSGETIGCVAAAQGYRAAVLYEWDRLEVAEDLIRSNIPLLVDCGPPENLIGPRLVLARIEAAKGAHGAALGLIEDAAAICRDRPFPGLAPLVRYERDRLLARQGDQIAAAAVDSAAIPPAWNAAQCLPQLARCRAWLNAGAPDQAAALAARLKHAASVSGRRGRWLEIVLIEAIAQDAAGQRQRALSTLAGALPFAEAEGYLRPFLDEGPAMAGLVTALSNSGGTAALAPYLASLRDRLHNEPPTPQRPAADTEGAGPTETLSSRERDILRLMAMGKRNGDISSMLNISPNTVKWHLKNIFSKLMVANRTEASAAARRMGLI